MLLGASYSISVAHKGALEEQSLVEGEHKLDKHRGSGNRLLPHRCMF